jgi:glycerate 2-kinase
LTTSTAELRVLIAPQELKGTLTAVEAAEAMAVGLGRAYPRWSLDVLPMADGGPGTTDALLAALGGERRVLLARDPLMRPVEAAWGVLPGRRAVIECAAASGLLRLRPDELDARRATSYGTGQVIAAALNESVEELLIGLGGSATNDGGAGMAQALGFRLLDAQGRDLSPGGAALARLDSIDPSGSHPGLKGVRCTGATDVTNPLCGPAGASAVYGPQKGADAAAIAELDAALARFATVVQRDLGVDVLETPGAGAAGGLGAGILAFLGAGLRSGAEVVGEAAGIEARIALADLVITGEGRLDAQTAYGKTPQYVARLARAASKPVLCIAGVLGEGYESSASLFAAIEATGEAGGALPSPEVAAQRVGEASVRGVQALVRRGVIPAPGA